MNPSFFPTFFLVGAPRCGTTSLSEALRKNPQICFSKPKETHYFSKISREVATGDLRSGYLDRYFSHYDPERHRTIGEGSVSYLFAPDAIREILEWNPEARFIAMVRSPLDMIPSYHAKLLYILQEDREDLAEAWALQGKRARGRAIPRGCLDPRLLQYAQIGMLGRRIDTLFRIAGRERCLVVTFDDLRSDPLALYRRTLDFVGADDDARTAFRHAHASRYYRFRWLQRLYALHRPNANVVQLADSLEERSRSAGRPRSLRKRLTKRLIRLNRVERPRVPLRAEVRETLRKTFAADVDHLGRLLGRDLSPWLDGAAAPPFARR